MPCMEPSTLLLLMTHFMSFFSTLCHLITTVNILCKPRTFTLHVLFMAVMLQLITLNLFFDVGHPQRCTISLKMVQQMSSEVSEPH